MGCMGMVMPMGRNECVKPDVGDARCEEESIDERDVTMTVASLLFYDA